MLICQVKFKKYKTTYYERKVVMILSSLSGECASMGTFQDNFKEELEKIPRKSVGIASMFYKIYPGTFTNQIEIWHVKLNNEPDRHIATVSFYPEP